MDYNNMTVGELVDDLNNRNVGSYSADNRILKKIQNKEYDDEVKEFINEALKWYQDHSRELLTD